MLTISSASASHFWQEHEVSPRFVHMIGAVDAQAGVCQLFAEHGAQLRQLLTGKSVTH